MVFSTALKLFLTTLVYLAIFFLALLFVPGIPPHETFEAYSITPPMKLEGKLAPNNILDKAEAIIDGEIIGGAESIAVQGDIIYTGSDDGTIIKYDKGKIGVVAKTGKDCEGPWEPSVCGRPLGIRLEPSGKLLVADAYYGILRVNPKDGKVEPLFPYDKPIGGHVPRLADDLDVSKDGTIYWSDASHVYSLWETTAEFLTNIPHGRLIKFDPKTKQNTVLIDNIRFANGVQLSRDEVFVLVAETGKARVLRYYLKGSKAGTHDVFIDGLPAFPDNLRSNGKGGFYISLVASREIADIFGPIPAVRKLAARLRSVLLLGVSLLDNIFSKNVYVEELKHYVGHLGPLGKANAVEGGTIIVEVNDKGTVIGSLQSKNSKMSLISQFTISDNYAYLGSPYVPQVWRIKTSELTRA